MGLSSASKYKGGLKSGIVKLGLNRKDDIDIQYTEVEKAIASYIELLMKHMGKKAIDKGLDEGSPMIQSINALPVESEKNKYTVNLTYDKSGTFFDSGRKQGKRPPLDGIINWIKYKPEVYAFAKKKVSISKLSIDKAVKGLAFGIATNIGKHGTIKRFGYKGSNWLKEVFGNDNSIIVHELSEVVSNVIGRDVSVWVTKQANTALNGSNNSK